MSSVARHYAQACLQSLSDQMDPEVFERLDRDFGELARLSKQNEAFGELVHNPELVDAAPQTLLAMAKQLNLLPEAARLFGLLLTNGRGALVDDLRRELTCAVDARAKRQRAHVRAAVPLSERQLEHLSEVLAAQVGQPVRLDVETDTSLMGGLVVELGNLTFDMSLERQLVMAAEELSRYASPTTAVVTPSQES